MQGKTDRHLVNKEMFFWNLLELGVNHFGRRGTLEVAGTNWK